MGKKTKNRTKYRHLDEDKDLGDSKTHHKRNEVETTNGNNSKVDVKKNEVGDNNECNISLIEEGIKYDVNCDTNQEKNIPDSKKKEGKVLYTEHHEEILNDTTAQNDKMECNESIISHKSNKKHKKERNRSSSSSRRKENKKEDIPYQKPENDLGDHNETLKEPQTQKKDGKQREGLKKERMDEKNHERKRRSSSNRRKENKKEDIVYQKPENDLGDHNETLKEPQTQKKDGKQREGLKKERIDEKNHERKRSSSSNRRKENKKEDNMYQKPENNLGDHNETPKEPQNQKKDEKQSGGLKKERIDEKNHEERKRSSSSNRKKHNKKEDIIHQKQKNNLGDHNETLKEPQNQKKHEKQSGGYKKERVIEKDLESFLESSSSNRKKQNKKDDIAQKTSKDNLESYNKTPHGQHNQNEDESRKLRLKDEECFKNTGESQKRRRNKNSSDNKDYNKGNDSNSKHNSSHYLNKTEYKRQPFIEDEECVLEEIDENLFNLPNEFSLAHCVAEDLRMGAGIAVDFKRIYGGVGQLFDQHLKVGNVGIINRKGRYVFYLITKKRSSGKPNMKSLEQTLFTLLTKMKEHNITKLGIPKIGCGLDGLDWSNVKSLINHVFTRSGIHITVCVPSNITEEKRLPSLKVYITPKNLWEIEAQTHIIIFIDLVKAKSNNWSDETVDKVNDRYPFKDNLLKDIKTKRQNPGDIINYSVNGEIITCAFVLQNSYTSIENVSINIKHLLKRYTYLAIQSGSLDLEGTFERISRIVLIFRSIINFNELWLCGNTELEEDLTYDQYSKNKLNFSMNSSMSSFNYSANNSWYQNKSVNSSNQMDCSISSNSQERNYQNRSRSTLHKKNCEMDVKYPELNKKN